MHNKGLAYINCPEKSASVSGIKHHFLYEELFMQRHIRCDYSPANSGAGMAGGLEKPLFGDQTRTTL